jgi:glutathione synthase/RimK-type ligase-like ATP-grasp enzyme
MARTSDWTFPVVLKPDVGQRGLGVAVVARGGGAGGGMRRKSDPATVVQAYVQRA